MVSFLVEISHYGENRGKDTEERSEEIVSRHRLVRLQGTARRVFLGWDLQLDAVKCSRLSTKGCIVDVSGL